MDNRVAAYRSPKPAPRGSDAPRPTRRPDESPRSVPPHPTQHPPRPALTRRRRCEDTMTCESGRAVATQPSEESRLQAACSPRCILAMLSGRSRPASHGKVDGSQKAWALRPRLSASGRCSGCAISPAHSRIRTVSYGLDKSARRRRTTRPWVCEHTPQHGVVQEHGAAAAAGHRRALVAARGRRAFRLRERDGEAVDAVEVVLEDGERVEEVRDLLGGGPAVRRKRRPPRRTAPHPTRGSSRIISKRNRGGGRGLTAGSRRARRGRRDPPPPRAPRRGAGPP